MGVAALVFPVESVLSWFREAAAVKQYGGRPWFWGLAGGVITELIIAGFMVLLSYMCLRWAITGNGFPARKRIRI